MNHWRYGVNHLIRLTGTFLYPQALFSLLRYMVTKEKKMRALLYCVACSSVEIKRNICWIYMLLLYFAAPGLLTQFYLAFPV